MVGMMSIETNRFPCSEQAANSGLVSYVARPNRLYPELKDVKWLQTITMLLIFVEGVITADNSRLFHLCTFHKMIETYASDTCFSQ